MRNVEQFPLSRGRSPCEAPPEGLSVRASADRGRLEAAAAGNPRDVAAFLTAISGVVWSVCRLVSEQEAEARDIFLEVIAALSANRFARLKAHDGRATLETVIALSVRELLSERVLRLLQVDADKGWRAFENLFKSDIERLIRRRLSAGASLEERRDAYQEISLGLVEGGYRRLNAYDGSGSFAGFVLKSVDRILIDCLRREKSRRRLPAAVLGLAPLDQEVFKLVFWRGLPERPELLAPHLASRLGSVPELADVAASILRLRSLSSHGTPPIRLVPIDELDDLPGPDSQSPENDLLRSEEEEQISAALEVLSKVMDDLPEAEQLYVRIALSGSGPPPSREIARLMRRPVEEIYKLKQRVLQRLRDIMTKESAIKSWRVSV
jgi:RNA polymerase sigma factor (sigma-70 family)